MLLDPAVGKVRKVRAANPERDRKKPCVYVGMTGLTPEERFANHKAGTKAAWIVKRYGLRLLPELYQHLNPMPHEAAAQADEGQPPLGVGARHQPAGAEVGALGGQVPPFTAGSGVIGNPAWPGYWTSLRAGGHGRPMNPSRSG